MTSLPFQNKIRDAENEFAAMLNLVERAARDPAVDVNKLDRMLDRAETFRMEEAKRQFNLALALVQSEMRSVAADATNPQTRSRYATYHALDKALRPIYSAHRFALTFDTKPRVDNSLMVVCYVSHDGYVREY